MSRKKVVLVSGAGGEMGNGLIHKLAESLEYDILALDLKEVDEGIGGCARLGSSATSWTSDSSSGW